MNIENEILKKNMYVFPLIVGIILYFAYYQMKMLLAVNRDIVSYLFRIYSNAAEWSYLLIPCFLWLLKGVFDFLSLEYVRCRYAAKNALFWQRFLYFCKLSLAVALCYWIVIGASLFVIGADVFLKNFVPLSFLLLQQFLILLLIAQAAGAMERLMPKYIIVLILFIAMDVIYENIYEYLELPVSLGGLCAGANMMRFNNLSGLCLECMDEILILILCNICLWIFTVKIVSRKQSLGRDKE